MTRCVAPLSAAGQDDRLGHNFVIVTFTRPTPRTLDLQSAQCGGLHGESSLQMMDRLDTRRLLVAMLVPEVAHPVLDAQLSKPASR